MTRSRYLLVAGLPADPVVIRSLADDNSRRTGLSQVAALTSGFLLHDKPTRIVKLGEEAFQIVGLVHERDPNGDRSASNSLFNRLWGQFVAISEPCPGAVRVMRDPSGFMPCYHASIGRGFAVTSDVDLLFVAGLLKPIVDRGALFHHLRADALRTSGTCLTGVTELYPGWSLEIGATGLRTRQRWSPFDHTLPSIEIRDPTTAAQGLRRVIDETIGTLASRFSKPLLSISGGLDSSVVACALANSAKPFECITLATKEAAGDERAYARPLAQALDVMLHEYFEDTSLVDLTASDSLHLPRPVSRSFSQSADRIQARLAQQIGADAYFHGGGGDNIFCFMTSSRVITDRLIRDGLRAAWKTSLDMVDLTGGSLYEAWRGALRRRWLQSSEFRWPRSDLLLSFDRAPAGDQPDDQHPWLYPPPDCLPGKVLHVASLAGIANRLEGYGREKTQPILAPLLAQPVVEYCLRIPTWLWCQDGMNRATARLAYADMLPPSIAKRTTKGTPSALAFRLIEDNRALIRDRLAGGLLADWGLVRVPGILAALDLRHHLTMDECARIALLNDAESWARGWEAKRLSNGHYMAGPADDGSGRADSPIRPASQL